MSELAVHWISIVPDTSKIAPQIKKSMGDTGKTGQVAGATLGSRFAGAAGRAAKKAAKGGMLAVAAGITAAGVAGVKAAKDMNQTRAVLSGLYGSAGKADVAMKGLRDVSRNSPISYSAYLKAGESMAYMGIEGDQASTILRNVGDAITATGGGATQLDQVNRGLLKMVNSGRVYAADLNMISDAGVPIFEGLAEHFGTSAENVKEMVRGGAVELEDVLSVMENATGDSFQKQLKAAEEAKQTLTNSFWIAAGNIGDSLGALLEGPMAGLAPMVRGVGTALERGIVAYGPAVVSVIGQIGSVIGFAAGIIGRVVGFLYDFRAITGPLAVGILALATAFKVKAIALRLVNASLAIQRTLMLTNPIFLVIAGILALAAAFVVAYKNSETFRNIVQGAWEGIKTAVSVAWEGFIKPALTAFWSFISQTLWPIIQQFYSSVVQPVFSLIGTVIGVYVSLVVGYLRLWWGFLSNVLFPVIRFLYNNVVRPIFTAIGAAIGLAWGIIRGIFSAWGGYLTGVLFPVIRFLWNNVVQPVFSAVWTGIQFAWGIIRGIFQAWWAYMSNVLFPIIRFLWNNVVSPIFKAVQFGIQFAWSVIRSIFGAWWAYMSNVLFPVIRFLWNNVVQPVFSAIGSFIRTAWTSVIRPIFQAIWNFIQNTLAPVFRWLYNNVVRPVFGWIGDRINNIWNNRIRPAFDKMREGVDRVKSAFEAARDGIGRAWESLRDLVRRPIRAAVRFVNNRLIGIPNKTGLNKLPGVDITRIPMAGWDTGGWTGRGGKYKPAGIVHADEFVISKRARRLFEAGNPGMLDFINRTGRMPLHGDHGGYADGGRVLPGYSPGGRVINARLSNPHSRAQYPWATFAGDFAAPMGTPVRAWKPGRVSATNRWGHSYGWHVRMNHPDNTSSLYAHLSSIAVRIGQMLQAGGRIGGVGSTGNSTGPHLHLETMGGHYSGGGGGGGGFSLPNPFDIVKNLMPINVIRNAIAGAAAGEGGVLGDSNLASMLRWATDNVWKHVKDAVSAISPAAFALNRGTELVKALFDQGGLAVGSGFMPKQTIQPERVLSPRQTAAFESWMDRGGLHAGGQVDLSQASVDALAQAILAGASDVSTRQVVAGIDEFDRRTERRQRLEVR